jgi:hypothetical protein
MPVKKKERVFKREDYQSGDGMLTAVWGPSLWHFLHIMSFNYPLQPTESDKEHYAFFVLNLRYTLPCRYCRENLTKYFTENPLNRKVMTDRNTFSRFIYKLHETINTLLNKKSGLSYCDVRERYEHFRSRCIEERPPTASNASTASKATKQPEKGCTEPLYGKKSKCVIKIVPQEEQCPTFQMAPQCLKSR